MDFLVDQITQKRSEKELGVWLSGENAIARLGFQNDQSIYMDWFQDALCPMTNSNGFFQFSSLMMSVKEED